MRSQVEAEVSMSRHVGSNNNNNVTIECDSTVQNPTEAGKVVGGVVFEEESTTLA